MISHPHTNLDIDIIFILEMSKLRLREVQWLSRSHTGGEWALSSNLSLKSKYFLQNQEVTTTCWEQKATLSNRSAATNVLLVGKPRNSCCELCTILSKGGGLHAEASG